jgi:hypothetical protein
MQILIYYVFLFNIEEYFSQPLSAVRHDLWVVQMAMSQ